VRNIKQLIFEAGNAIQHIDDHQQEAIRNLAANNIKSIMSKQKTTNNQHKQQLHLIKQTKTT
jgi:hypothetical protein